MAARYSQRRKSPSPRRVSLVSESRTRTARRSNRSGRGTSSCPIPGRPISETFPRSPESYPDTSPGSETTRTLFALSVGFVKEEIYIYTYISIYVSGTRAKRTVFRRRRFFVGWFFFVVPSFSSLSSRPILVSRRHRRRRRFNTSKMTFERERHPQEITTKVEKKREEESVNDDVNDDDGRAVFVL